MKRFIGWGFVLVGGSATVWGGFALLTGAQRARVQFGPETSIDALTGGLAGLAALTIGLIWVRD